MDYKKLGKDFIVRVDPGEEIIASLTKVMEAENIVLGSVSGLGAVNQVTLGLFRVAPKEYVSKTLDGEFEISSLLGTASTMDGKPYLHLHITVSNEDLNVFGGHLNGAVVSATAEIVIHTLDGSVDRKFSETVGLNLLELD